MRYRKDDETAQAVIDLALVVGCDYHPAEYGPCAHCVEAAERVIDAGYVGPEEAKAREAAARREAHDRLEYERGLRISSETELARVECDLADAEAKVVAARREALLAFADTRGVNVGDEDGEWWQGYRQAQRECLHDATKAAEDHA